MLIYCIESDKNGIITNLGWAYEESDNVEGENPNEYKNTQKEEFIKQAKSNKLENKIKTTKNNNVSIISDKYLRTDGDSNENNDMLDLDSCDKFVLDIMNDTFWKNAKYVVNKRHLDFNYINNLKEKSKTDENSLRELLEIQQVGKSSLSEVSHEFEIPVKPYLDSLNIYKNNNITNFYCRKLIEEYSSLLKNTESKTYKKTSMDYFSGFDYSSMSSIKEPFNKIIENKLIKQYYMVVFRVIFDNIDNFIVDISVSTSVKNTITETFNKSKKENDWISINMVSLKIIEPLLREFFIKKKWLYKKTNLKNKTLSELLDTKDFRDKYPNICNGLKMILCDYLGLNLRNSEFHNLTENSSDPLISKISFICISSILDLFEDINIDKYYKISKSKIGTNDYKPLKNDINPHLEAINYLQYEFMLDRNDTRIDKVFENICIPNGVNQKDIDIDFSKYSVEEFLREVMKLKN